MTPTKPPLPGVPWATFRYKGDPSRQRYRGVIAQDVEAAGYGHLVVEINGIKHVRVDLAPQLTPIPIGEDEL